MYVGEEPLVYCARHAATDAAWECARCAVLHCDACVRRVGNDRRAIAACSHCDGVLNRLQVRVMTPVGEEVRALLRRPFTPTGLITTAVVGGVMGLSDVPIPLVALAIELAALVMLAASAFNVVQHAACGRPGFPAPAEAFGPAPATLAARGALCLMVVATPFGLWLAHGHGFDSVTALAAAHPVSAVVIGLLALTWLTAAVLAMVLSGSGLAAYWPPALVQAVVLDPLLFGRLCGLMVGSTAALVLLRRAVSAAAGTIPFVSTVVLTAVTALAVFAQAAVLGGFLHRHREAYEPR